MMQRLTAFAAALAVAQPGATGEMLHVASTCPGALPTGACLGDAAWKGADWHGVTLPLNDSKTYVESLLQTAIEVEHSTKPVRRVVRPI